MAIIAWLVVGVGAGVLVHALVGHMPGGLVAAVAGAMAGAFVGGGAFSLMAGERLDTLSPAAALCSLAGGVLVPLLLRAADAGGSAERHPRL